MDPRTKKLAENLLHFSCSLQKGEKVLIEAIGEVDDLARALVKEAYAMEAVPFLWINNNIINREYLQGLRFS